MGKSTMGKIMANTMFSLEMSMKFFSEKMIKNEQKWPQEITIIVSEF